MIYSATDRKAGQREQVGMAESEGSSELEGPEVEIRPQMEQIETELKILYKTAIPNTSPSTQTQRLMLDACLLILPTLPCRKRPELYSLEQRQTYWECNIALTSKFLICVDPF